ncbi:MAG TPA: YhcN/YlaJ family sporulation lipoprotein [Chondromyces sp.]|nr:YhcN/YlaJ family sporulation lipoprotein [Chondromyces sp.]
MRICFIVILLLSLAGCGQNNESGAGNGRENQSPQTVNVRNININQDDRKSGQQTANHLANLASSVPNVQNANAVVLGPYAVVGIDVDSNLDRSQVGSIKYAVAESLKDDPHGANAIVVADPDTTARIREIGNDIENGAPIQGIINELADITGRVMPEIPQDIRDPNQPNEALEKPQKDMNENREKKLEQEQEDQSNHHK